MGQIASTKQTVRQWRQLTSHAMALLLSVLIFLTVSIVTLSVRQTTQTRLENQATTYLSRLVASLDATLARHSYLSVMLAQESSIRSYLQQAPNAPTTGQLNHYLERVNAIAGTLDIYLMKVNGSTVASSNWYKELSFIGNNFAFRPYFQQAMQGHLGRYYAVGTTSNERGYYFASAVRDEQGAPIGVIAVKISVNSIENFWQREPVDFFVLDQDGIIFMASQDKALFHSFIPLTPVRSQQLRDSLRYPPEALQPLQDFQLQALAPPYTEIHWQHQRYLATQQEMVTAGWQVYLLANWQSATQVVQLSMVISLALSTLTALVIFMLWKYQTQRRRYEQTVLERLETKVAERTEALQMAQAELIQATKMATLGQLSAAINHELNNPLGAIRAYADNARQFLDLGRLDMTRTNLQEIASLTERMARITRQLKAFARKSSGQAEPIPLQHAIDSALIILKPRFAQTNLQIQQQLDPQLTHVCADLIWLEQILVNLLSNALEATQDRPQGHIVLTTTRLNQQAQIQIWDNGLGIKAEDLSHLFEPFFTTKSAGHGLGLGLSISQRLAQDMQGDLQAANHPQGGAVFTLLLPIACPEEA